MYFSQAKYVIKYFVNYLLMWLWSLNEMPAFFIFICFKLYVALTCRRVPQVEYHWSKLGVCARSLAGIAGSNSAWILVKFDVERPLHRILKSCLNFCNLGIRRICMLYFVNIFYLGSNSWSRESWRYPDIWESKYFTITLWTAWAFDLLD
jgi:hypothetical protein